MTDYGYCNNLYRIRDGSRVLKYYVRNLPVKWQIFVEDIDQFEDWHNCVEISLVEAKKKFPYFNI